MNDLMEHGWNGLPYNPISNFYKKKFAAKIYKIPVSVVDDCPNRRGLKGMKTCLFCDVWGSAAHSESHKMPLREQIQTYKTQLQKRFKAEQFLVYFQAYTNTFTKLSELEKNFQIALEFPDVVGFVVGTRPDCISQGVLKLWKEISEKSFLSVELGVQSFFDDQLEFMRRGHSSLDSLRAIQRISEMSSIDLGVHLMFGQPGETDQDMILTAEVLNQWPLQHVKLHNLHVLTHTPLADLYAQGAFQPISREDYARRVQIFLEHLRPQIYIHRLAAYASRREELIAPDWTAHKMGTHQYLVDYLRAQGTYQSRYYISQSPHEKLLQEQLHQQSLPSQSSFKFL